MPDGFTECPRIRTGAELYWTAFCELSSDRQMGASIPFAAIDRYAARYRLGDHDVEEFDLLRFVVRALDAVALGNESALEDDVAAEIASGRA